MYQSANANQRMKIGVRIRYALFLSFAAHLFVLWVIAKDHVSEAEMEASGLAVTIALRPSKPQIARPASPPLLPAYAAKLLVGKDTMASQVHKDDPTPIADAPAILNAPVIAVSVPSKLASLDADGLRRYRLALARETHRAWVYPQQALTHKLEGTTEIRLELMAGGRFVAARIEKSSGHPALDDAALKIITKAANAAPVPNSLFGEPVSILLPVVFSIGSENRE